jgi:hypothetical protein
MMQHGMETAELAAATCSHHWVIESPNGPTSVGECRACGEVREFKNSIQITSWESEGSHLHRNHAIANP